MKSEKFHVRRMVQGRRRMWSMLAHTWKTIDCVKERIDSCLSGSEFVNPFFAFSSLLFFLVWTVCVTLSRRSCTILLTNDFLKSYFQFSSSYPKKNLYDKSLFPQLPERHRTCCCHIQRIHSMWHRDLHCIIASFDCLLHKSVPLGSKNYCKLFFTHKLRIINAYGIIGQCKCCCLIPKCFQAFDCLDRSDFFPVASTFCIILNKCPWNLKYSSHTHSGCSSIQRITAPWSQ